MKNILFVCTGNTCRSPMAENLFNNFVEINSLLRDEDINLKSESAGIEATDGNKASDNAINVLQNYSIDISKHNAKKINQEILSNVDIILTMTAEHKQKILDNFIINKNQTIKTIKEFAYNREIIEGETFYNDISDPFEKDIQIYKDCMYEIKDAVINIIKRLEEN